MPFARIVTCCYCGTTASLPKKPLPGRLGCASCSAPLRRVGVAAVADAPTQKRGAAMAVPIMTPERPDRAPRKGRRGKPVLARLWDRFEDAVEDVVDEIFD